MIFRPSREDAVALRQASRTFKKYWPNAGEVFELLEARAARLKREIAALDAIAKGRRERTGPAREAFGYVQPPPPPQREARVALHPTREEIATPTLTVEQQLAAFGLTPESAAAALAATNARRQPAPGEPLPVNTNEPEKLRLKVVR